MPQPQFGEIFGSSASIDPNGLSITIALGDLGIAGLDELDPNKPLSILAGIIKNASFFLLTNTDEAVPAACTFQIISPTNRNQVDKTEFIFSFSFFNIFIPPDFDPDTLE